MWLFSRFIRLPTGSGVDFVYILHAKHLEGLENQIFLMKKIAH